MTDDNVEQKEKPIADLGWHNAEVCRPRIDDALAKCRALKHQREDVDVGPPNRGLEHVVTCYECRFRYRYDSSD